MFVAHDRHWKATALPTVTGMPLLLQLYRHFKAALLQILRDYRLRVLYDAWRPLDRKNR